MNIDKKLDELFSLLDKNKDIKKINELKERISDKEISLINNYRNNSTIENKKLLYDNLLINDYLIAESNLNYLIMEINNKFKRRKSCAGNKW